MPARPNPLLGVSDPLGLAVCTRVHNGCLDGKPARPLFELRAYHPKEVTVTPFPDSSNLIGPAQIFHTQGTGCWPVFPSLEVGTLGQLLTLARSEAAGKGGARDLLRGAP